MGVRGEIFTTKVMLQNRTYFFNVKENRLGDIYLNIVESKNRDEGGFDRQSVILFAEDLQEFLQGFDESLRVLEKSIREKKRGGKSAASDDVPQRYSSERQAPERRTPERRTPERYATERYATERPYEKRKEKSDFSPRRKPFQRDKPERKGDRTQGRTGRSEYRDKEKRESFSKKESFPRKKKIVVRKK